MPHSPKKNNPSVVVLVLDQLSASMLGPYGNTFIDTPQFDRLAARSLLFDFAFANAVGLEEGYDSLWGNTPNISMGVPDHPDPFAISAVSSPPPSFLDLIADEGIESTLLTDDPIVAEHRFAQFDRIISYEAPSVIESASSVSDTQLAAFFAQATGALMEMEPGSLLWLHSQGLRGNWDAPYRYREEISDPEDPAPPTSVQSPSGWLDPDSVDPDELLGLQQAAFAQVRVMDELLGLMLDMIDSDTTRQPPLFCLLSGRGCPLGEHGLVGPGAQLYNESVQVPLMIALPEHNHPLRAMRSGSLVQPDTVITRFKHWLTNDRAAWNRDLQALASSLPDRKREAILLSSNEQESIQTHAWKMIRSKMGGTELFVKPDDRCEINDVSTRCPEIVSPLTGLLDLEPVEPWRSWQAERELPKGLY